MEKTVIIKKFFERNAKEFSNYIKLTTRILKEKNIYKQYTYHSPRYGYTDEWREHSMIPTLFISNCFRLYHSPISTINQNQMVMQSVPLILNLLNIVGESFDKKIACDKKNAEIIEDAIHSCCLFSASISILKKNGIDYHDIMFEDTSDMTTSGCFSSIELLTKEIFDYGGRIVC